MHRLGRLRSRLPRGIAHGCRKTGEKITLNAQIVGADGRALDPQNHDSDTARKIATDLCSALAEAYGKHETVRPETLAIAVQTVLETLLSGIEREGVDAASMRVALANSVLVNGRADVTIEVDGKQVPSLLADGGATVH